MRHAWLVLGLIGLLLHSAAGVGQQAALLSCDESNSPGIEVLKDGYGGVSVKTSGGAAKAAGLTFSWASVAPGRLEVSINPVLLKRLADAQCASAVFHSGKRGSLIENLKPRGASRVGAMNYYAETLLSDETRLEICGDSFRFGSELNCQLHAMSKAIQAQGLPLASMPLAAPSNEYGLDLDPGEPFGLAIIGGVSTTGVASDLFTGGRVGLPAKLRLTWGMPYSEVGRQMGLPPQNRFAKNFEGPMTCTPEVTGVRTCFTSPSAPWRVDFGDAQVGEVSPFLSFAPDGKFYAYFATFRAEAFDLVLAILVKRLGKPTSDVPGTVQNRMGATFDQQVVQWQLPHVRVEIQRRGTDLLTGILRATYLPLAAKIPEPPEGTAPM